MHLGRQPARQQRIAPGARDPVAGAGPQDVGYADRDQAEQRAEGQPGADLEQARRYDRHHQHGRQPGDQRERPPDSQVREHRADGRRAQVEPARDEQPAAAEDAQRQRAHRQPARCPG